MTTAAKQLLSAMTEKQIHAVLDNLCAQRDSAPLGSDKRDRCIELICEIHDFLDVLPC